MATYTVQNLARAGIIDTYAAVASADDFVDQGDERTFLRVRNGSGSSINVTVTVVDATHNRPGLGLVTVADEVIAVGAGVDKMIGPFTKAYINNANKVSIAYSATSSVTAGAIRVPNLSRGI